MAQKRTLPTFERKRNIVDFDKVDQLHTALGALLLTMSTEEELTPREALTAVMRMFSHLVAAYVSQTDVAHTDGGLEAEIDAYCRDAAALAKARLREVRHYEVFEGDAGPI
jgi:hypothetical protein